LLLFKLGTALKIIVTPHRAFEIAYQDQAAMEEPGTQFGPQWPGGTEVKPNGPTL